MEVRFDVRAGGILQVVLSALELGGNVLRPHSKAQVTCVGKAVRAKGKRRVGASCIRQQIIAGAGNGDRFFRRVGADVLALAGEQRLRLGRGRLQRKEGRTSRRDERHFHARISVCAVDLLHRPRVAVRNRGVRMHREDAAPFSASREAGPGNGRGGLREQHQGHEERVPQRHDVRCARCAACCSAASKSAAKIPQSRSFFLFLFLLLEYSTSSTVSRTSAVELLRSTLFNILASRPPEALKSVSLRSAEG